jgi:hypothetical protein
VTRAMAPVAVAVSGGGVGAGVGGGLGALDVAAAGAAMAVGPAACGRPLMPEVHRPKASTRALRRHTAAGQ